jgi:hypothetical protein
MNKNSLLLRKAFHFQTSRSVEQCLSILRGMDGTVANGCPVSVRFEGKNGVHDGKFDFYIESRLLLIKGWLFGTIEDQYQTAITGVVGIDPRVILLLLLLFSGAPLTYFLLPTRTPQDLIRFSFYVVSAAAALVAACIGIRNIIMSGLEAQILRGE